MCLAASMERCLLLPHATTTPATHTTNITRQDRAATAAAAAAAAAITDVNNRANDFAKMMRSFAKNVQDARKQSAKFNREFSMEVLKGGAKLAEQFSSSFDNTRRQGDIKKLEINNKSALDAQKIREQ